MGKKSKNKKIQEKNNPIRLEKKKQKRKKDSNHLKYTNILMNQFKIDKIESFSNPFIFIEQLNAFFEILTDFFNLNSNISFKAEKKLSNLLLNIQYDSNLYIDFDILLNEEKFYNIFLKYFKKIYQEKKELNKILNCNKNKSDYKAFFNYFKINDLKEILFENKISSYVSQDLLLNCFSSYNLIVDYINIIRMEDELYIKIDKNRLFIDEGIEEFKKNYLYSPVILEAIILTLHNFNSNINESELKQKIDLLLNKTNFYFAPLPQNFSSITFLGYNIVIRDYFYNFKNKNIKVCLRIVITHEIIHELVLEYSNNNFFNTSFISSNGKVEESGEYFEKILLGEIIYYYSNDDINYLSNSMNFSKKVSIFSSEISAIHSKYKSMENSMVLKNDTECILQNIIRTKKNVLNINDIIFVGKCSRSFRNYIIDK